MSTQEFPSEGFRSQVDINCGFAVTAFVCRSLYLHGAAWKCEWWWETVYQPVLPSFHSNRNPNQQQVAVGRKRIGRLNIDADADADEQFCKTCDLLRS